MLALCLALAGGPAWAQGEDPSLSQALDRNRAELERIEADLQKGSDRSGKLRSQAQEIASELSGLRAVLVEATDAAQRLERELTELQATLRGLEAQTAVRETELAARREQMAQLLAALQRLARVPTEALLAKPDLPNRTVRSALVLRSLLPRIKDKADEIAKAVSDLDALRDSTARRRNEVEQARADLSLREREISAMVQRREELYASTRQSASAEEVRAKELADKAQDLRELLASIQTQQQENHDRVEAEEETRARLLVEEAAAEEAARAELRRKLGRIADLRPPPLPPQRSGGAGDSATLATAEADAPDVPGRMASLAGIPGDGSPGDGSEDAMAAVPTSVTLGHLPVPPTPPARSDGAFRMPVEGRVTLEFGADDEVGLPSAGVMLASRAGAPVVAPMGGEVVFTGPFRGYGLVVIIKHSESDYSTLARVGRITTTVGRKVLAGEPVATVASDGAASLDLYYELRRNGDPINPQKVIAAAADKRQG